MGIPGLFAWIRTKCPHLVKISHPNKNNISNLCLDMNGVFHEACQKVYQYGNHSVQKSKVHKKVPCDISAMSQSQIRKKVFYEIGNIINNLMYHVKPTKRVLIMIDGPAGVAKQSQQRQRRYRSVHDTERKFDTNCISPGTEWMDFLSKYLDHFIRSQITSNRLWEGVEVIFSNEKVAGEGEHKLIKFIRNHGLQTESYMLYGLDADLIMLTLSTQNILSEGNSMNPPKFYILREDQYTQKLITIDILALRNYFIEELTWGLECNRNDLINDFVFLCFFLGNDFLPHSPTIDLIEGGIEILFDSYQMACEKNNQHLIVRGVFSPKVLKDIVYNISMSEKIVLEDSIKRGDKYADPLLQKYISYDEYKNAILDYDGYRNEYYNTKFVGVSRESVCHEYFRGMEWVYKYYTTGIPSWTWCYPYFYSPFATEMVSALDTYEHSSFSLGKPMNPLLQLVSILPPQSKYLIPEEFHSIVENFPSEVVIDLAGKKFDWQGIVLVAPLPNFIDKFEVAFENLKMNVKRRGFFGSEYIYKRSNTLNYEHKTYYGTIENCVASVSVFK